MIDISSDISSKDTPAATKLPSPSKEASPSHPHPSFYSPPGFSPTPHGRFPSFGSYTIPLSSIDLTDINLEKAMNCPFIATCKGDSQLPELSTEGKPLMAVKLFTVLMNQLAIDPPSPQVVHPLPSQAVLALPTPTVADATPSRKRGFPVGSLRRSVRVRATGDDGTDMLTKAQKRVQSSYNLRSGKKGIPLILNFSYTRLIVREVEILFRAYNIRLGLNELHAGDIIRNIQTLDRANFEDLINQAFAKLKSHNSDHCLILDQDAQGILRIH